MGNCLASTGRLILGSITLLLSIVFGLVGFIIFEAIFLALTITGIGPLINYCYTIGEGKILERSAVLQAYKDLVAIQIPAGINAAAGGAYTLIARSTLPAEGDRKKREVVIIPNGLGATMVTISTMHEKLVNEGYHVVSFDRLGVGFSDVNSTGRFPTAQDIVKEMKFVIDTLVPRDSKMIIVGPSMGSIVAQCYIAAHPENVAGFVNLDGVPYPFLEAEPRFHKAGYVYKFYAAIMWTGLMRPFFSSALKSPGFQWIISNAFKLPIILAQMNQSNFFRNLAYEMDSMMDCCKYANAAWGDQSVLKLSDEDFMKIVLVKPAHNVEVDERVVGSVAKETDFRSKSEPGVLISREEAQSVIDKIASGKLVSSATEGTKAGGGGDGGEEAAPITITFTQPLTATWSKLVVRVMSGRNHDFGNSVANSFYSQRLRNLSSAEHTLHAVLARDGERTTYPKLTHGGTPALSNELVRCTNEISKVLSSSS